MSGLLFAVLAVVVVVAGFFARRRIRRVKRGETPIVTDPVLRRILEEGRAGGDALGGVEGGGFEGDDFEGGDPDDSEPLDEDAIREAEDRFRREAEWDDPEPF